LIVGYDRDAFIHTPLMKYRRKIFAAPSRPAIEHG